MQYYSDADFDGAVAYHAARPLLLEAHHLDRLPTPVPWGLGWLDAAVGAETRIMTEDGPVAAGHLQPGDAVLAYGLGPIEVLWVGRRRVRCSALHTSPHLAPLMLPAHAFGGGAPRNLLRLSPRAGVLVDLPGGPANGLIVPAAGLARAYGAEGPDARPAADLDYVQILTARHALLGAEGILVESLHPAAVREDDPLWAELGACLPDIQHAPALFGPDAAPRAAPWRARP